MSHQVSYLLHHLWVSCGTRAIELEPFEVIMIGLEGAGKSSILKHLRRKHSIGAVQYSSVGEDESSPKSSMRRRPSFGNLFGRSHKKRIKTFVSHVGVTVESIESSPWNHLEVSSWTVGRSSSSSSSSEQTETPQPRHYYSGANAVVFVVDGTDRDGISVARKELQRMINARELVSAPVVVFANKQDCHDFMSLSEIRVRMGLDKMLKGREWRLQGVSTKKDDEGIALAFEWLLSGTPTMPLRYDLPRLLHLYQQGRATLLVDSQKVIVSNQRCLVRKTKKEKHTTKVVALKAHNSNIMHTVRLMRFMCNLSPEIAGMILEYLGDTGRVAGNEDKYRKLS